MTARRRVAAAIVLLLMLSGAATGAIADSMPTPAGAVAACSTGRLSVRFRSGSPGVDQRTATLVLTNRSATTCHTYGYVGLGLLGYRNRVIHSRILRAREPRPTVVVLPPHGQAHALLRWSTLPGRGDPVSGCPIPLRIEVTPPDQRTHLTLSWGDRSEVCERGTISVTTLIRGR